MSAKETTIRLFHNHYRLHVRMRRTVIRKRPRLVEHMLVRLPRRKQRTLKSSSVAHRIVTHGILVRPNHFGSDFHAQFFRSKSEILNRNFSNRCLCRLGSGGGSCRTLGCAPHPPRPRAPPPRPPPP